MKKLVLAGVLSLLVLTGCGKKETVVCTQNQNASGSEIDAIINVYLEGSRFRGLDMNIDIVVPESMQSYKKMLVNALETQYKNMVDDIGVMPETTETEKGAKITMEMTAEQAKEYSGGKDKITKKEVIDIYTKQGFECK